MGFAQFAILDKVLTKRIAASGNENGSFMSYRQTCLHEKQREVSDLHWFSVLSVCYLNFFILLETYRQ